MKTSTHQKTCYNVASWAFILYLWTIPNLWAQTSLTVGDIAFVAYEMNNPDRFAFVLLEDIEANTQIHFTDRGWSGSSFITVTNESTCTWTATTSLGAGTVVTIETSNGAPNALPNFGNAAGKLDGLNGTSGEKGDQILAYQSNAGIPIFITGLTSREWSSTIRDYEEDKSVLPSGLGFLSSAFGHDFDFHLNNGRYIGCITKGNKDQLRHEINHPHNWSRSSNSVWPTQFPSFEVSQDPIPWPGTQLDAGDIAFIAYQTDDPDRIAFVLLEDVDAGTQIRFTDQGWSGGRFYAAINERGAIWTTDQALQAGEVIVITDFTANIGTVCGRINLLNNTVGENGDNIFAFQGDIRAPVFLAGLATKEWNNFARDYEEDVSKLPSALNTFNTAFGYSFDYQVQNGYFNGCITQGNKGQLRREIHNPQNWVRSNSVNWPSSIPSFTVTEDIEPWPGTVLATGDIAFVAYQTDDPDRFAFVLLEDVEAGTKIRFTDQGWSGSSFYAAVNELSIIWTTDIPINAGKVITIQNRQANIGQICGWFNLLNNTSGESGDNIFAYQGDIFNPTFLAGLASREWDNFARDYEEDKSKLPLSLEIFNTAFGHDLEFQVENGVYRYGITKGNKNQIRREIHNPQNWGRSNNPLWPGEFPNFIITDNPEPWPGTLLAAGCVSFLAYQTDDPERFSFTLLEDVVAGTSIRFTDQGWNGGRFYAAINETGAIWTTDSALEAGTVVSIIDRTPSIGSLNGSLDLLNNTSGESGDNILAYQGNVFSPNFLTGLSSREWASNPRNYEEDLSRLPSNIALGTSAIGFSGQAENGFYSGALTTGTNLELAAAFNNASNWTRSNSPDWPGSFPNITVTSSVGCCIVPSPSFDFEVNCLERSVAFTNTTQGADASTFFSWDFDNDGITDTTISGNFTYQFTQAGTYEVSLYSSRGGCEEKMSQTIVVGTPPPTPSISADNNLTLCDGETVRLSGPPGYAGYQWSNGATSQSIEVGEAGSYSISVLGIDGCLSAPATVVVNVGTSPPPPNLSSSGPLNFCEGESIDLFAPAGFNSYQWSTGATSQSITVTEAGNYGVTVKNNSDCESMPSFARVEVISLPNKPLLSLSGENLVAQSNTTTYEWYINSILIPGINGPVFSPQESGTYTVIALNNGCASESSEGLDFIVTSVSESPIKGLKIWPNPSSGMVSISGNVENSGIIEFLIFNAMGQKVFHQEVDASNKEINIQLNLQQFSMGVYQIFFLQNARSTSKRLILSP